MPAQRVALALAAATPPAASTAPSSSPVAAEGEGPPGVRGDEGEGVRRHRQGAPLEGGRGPPADAVQAPHVGHRLGDHEVPVGHHHHPRRGNGRPTGGAPRRPPCWGCRRAPRRGAAEPEPKRPRTGGQQAGRVQHPPASLVDAHPPGRRVAADQGVAGGESRLPQDGRALRVLPPVVIHYQAHFHQGGPALGGPGLGRSPGQAEARPAGAEGGAQRPDQQRQDDGGAGQPQTEGHRPRRRAPGPAPRPRGPLRPCLRCAARSARRTTRRVSPFHAALRIRGTTRPPARCRGPHGRQEHHGLRALGHRGAATRGRHEHLGGPQGPCPAALRWGRRPFWGVQGGPAPLLQRK